MIQHRGSSSRSSSSSTSSSRSSTPTQERAEPKKSAEEWVCMKCKQSHDAERDECKVCGHGELKLIGEKPDPDPLVDEDYDGPTISNVREIQGFEEPEDSQTSRLGLILLVGLLLIAALVVLGLL